jgi:16S rRNA (guanine966-N2)-methyltransferase
MRIITGIAKGRKILAPEGMDTRPTSDRVKESVFNIISKKVYGARVLDLFSGTGNLGLESLSRGADWCTFIEKNKNTHKILIENINNLGFKDKSQVYNNDAFEVIEMIGKNTTKYDIIFLDPPYSKGLIEKAILKIDEINLINSDGIIMSEYDENDVIPEAINNFKIYRTEKYGRTKISFWNKED